jgi:hypothetical protein
MEETNMIYGVNLGRLSTSQRSGLLIEVHAEENSLMINSEQEEAIRRVVTVKSEGNLTVCTYTEEGEVPEKDYHLSQIHIGELLFDGAIPDHSRRKGVDITYEVHSPDADRIVELRKNPSDILRRLKQIGLKAEKDDLALYYGSEKIFT